MNPVALITGGSRGIGRGICTRLAQLGWDLVINYSSNRIAAEETASLCTASATKAGVQIRTEICQADIAQSSDRKRLLEATSTTFGRLHMLVNNAGVAPELRADVLSATEESFDRLINVNVKGPYFLTQAVANWMVEQGAPGPGEPERKIVTITSVSSYAASTNRGDYCISKAALSMITPLFASRLAEYGINVYEIRPGVIATDMTAAVRDKYDTLIQQGLAPIRRWGTPDDVAKAIEAIARDLFPFSTGEVINVDAGFHIRRL